MSDRLVIQKYIFPIVIIAALIWLAVQTLGRGSSHDRLRFSDALALARQGGGIRRGSSPFWNLLTSLLPFVLLFGFWVFLMRNVRRGEPDQPGSPRAFS